MGLSGSKLPPSYLRYDNDFELVIRATKDLERLLETKFGTPNGKNSGLHDKITDAAERHGISQSTVRLMRKLVTLRNQIVHDPSCNSLDDRASFARSCDRVIVELEEIEARRRRNDGGDTSNGGTNDTKGATSYCIVM